MLLLKKGKFTIGKKSCHIYHNSWNTLVPHCQQFGVRDVSHCQQFGVRDVPHCQQFGVRDVPHCQ